MLLGRIRGMLVTRSLAGFVAASLFARACAAAARFHGAYPVGSFALFGTAAVGVSVFEWGNRWRWNILARPARFACACRTRVPERKCVASAVRSAWWPPQFKRQPRQLTNRLLIPKRPRRLAARPQASRSCLPARVASRPCGRRQALPAKPCAANAGRSFRSPTPRPPQ